LILFEIIGKLAAVFITIPYPVLGGVQIIGFGMFIGLVMSNLQYIDMQSTRKLAIIGVSTLLGLMLPFWAKGNAAGINTGIILNNERHFMVIGERNICYSFFDLSQMVI
jgi:nucleobase transporter 1/2